MRVRYLGVAQERVRGAQAAVVTSQAIAHETRAVKAGRANAAPHVRVRAFVVQRPCASHGRSRIGASGVAVIRAARGRAAAIAAAAVVVGIIVLVVVPFLQRCSIACRLLLGKQLSGFGTQVVVDGLDLSNNGFSFVLDLFGFLCLLRSNFLLLNQNDLLRFDFGFQVFRFGNHVCIVLVQNGQKIPVVREFLEGCSAEQQIDNGQVAGAIHRACTRAHELLKLGNALRCGINAILSFLNGRFGGFLFGNGFHPVVRRRVQEFLLLGQLRIGGIGFGLLVVARRCKRREGKRQSQKKCERCTQRGLRESFFACK